MISKVRVGVKGPKIVFMQIQMTVKATLNALLIMKDVLLLLKRDVIYLVLNEMIITKNVFVLKSQLVPKYLKHLQLALFVWCLVLETICNATV